MHHVTRSLSAIFGRSIACTPSRCSQTRTFSVCVPSKLQDSTRTIPIQVGSSGTFDVTITNATDNATSLIVHLPSHFNSQSAQSYASLFTSRRLACEFPESTIVGVNYRLDYQHRFPIPIHDVFTAWDYIRKSFSGLPVHFLGTHIGGSLALSLALTAPNEISSVALLNPITDWTGLDEIAAKTGKSKSLKRERGDIVSTESAIEKRTIGDETKATKRELEAKAAKHLMSIRKTLFHKPSAYFDEFASPMLFLRAAGRDTPMNNLDAEREYSINGVKMRYGDEDAEVAYIDAGDDNIDHTYGPYDDEWHESETRMVREEYYMKYRGLVEVDDFVAPKKRKVLKRWPSTGQPETVDLPRINIFTSGTDRAEDTDEPDLAPILRLQAKEMVEVMRRACFWGREKSLAEDTVTLIDLKDAQHEEGHHRVLSWLRSQENKRLSQQPNST